MTWTERLHHHFSTPFSHLQIAIAISPEAG